MKMNFRKRMISSFPHFHPSFRRISIQLDGNEYGINQNGGTIPVNVYLSTTIRELRAAVRINQKNLFRQIRLFSFSSKSLINFRL